MITWDTYFSIVALLKGLVETKMPSKYAVRIADFVEKFDAVREPLIEWQTKVFVEANDTDRNTLWQQKMEEQIEIPKMRFSELPVDFTPTEVFLLRNANLW